MSEISSRALGLGGVGLTHVERYPGSKSCFEHAKTEAGADESCEVEGGGLWGISIHSNDSKPTCWNIPIALSMLPIP